MFSRKQYVQEDVWSSLFTAQVAGLRVMGGDFLTKSVGGVQRDDSHLFNSICHSWGEGRDLSSTGDLSYGDGVMYTQGGLGHVVYISGSACADRLC